MLVQKKARNLRKGDLIVLVNGAYAKIKSVSIEKEPMEVLGGRSMRNSIALDYGVGTPAYLAPDFEIETIPMQ